MRVAAAATDGFLSTARSMASLKVTRMTGSGAWADIEAVMQNATRAAVTGRRALRSCHASALALETDALDDDIQHRNECEIEEGRREHAAGDCGADRMTRLAAGPARHHERHHAENERKRRHENRPQADPRRFHRGVGNRHPARAQLLGELDDENAVLRRQADEHAEANLAVHIVDQPATSLC